MKPEAFILLTPGFAADEHDSTCIPWQQVFVRSLKKQHPQLYIIILSFQYPFVAKTYNWHGCTVMAFGGREKPRLSRLLIWLKVWRQLKLLHRQYAIQGLLSFWYGECAFTGSRFAKKYALPHRCWLQGQDARAGNKYVSWGRLKAGELIALSDFLANQFYKNYALLPGAVVPLGIEPATFKEMVTNRDIDIIGVGSLIPLKRYDIFIAVIAEIKNTLPRVKAMLCGDGPEKEKLQQMIAAQDLQENIILAGELLHRQVLQQMQRSKLLLHTSGYEGFGAVCTEALYAGCHVLSCIKIMDADIDHWHIVATGKEMAAKALQLLLQKNIDHGRVLPYTITDTVTAIMKLYNYSATAID